MTVHPGFDSSKCTREGNAPKSENSVVGRLTATKTAGREFDCRCYCVGSSGFPGANPSE